jgi:hypothetical protein
MMDFESRFKINKKNEILRYNKGIILLSDILDGVSLIDLMPFPYRCLCGNYPKISHEKDNFKASCINTECKSEVFLPSSSYQKIIFKWNTQPFIGINVNNVKIHPMLFFMPSYNSTNYLENQIKKIEQNLEKIKVFDMDKQEIKLIKLIESWNNFARYIGNKIDESSKITINLKTNEDKSSFKEDKDSLQIINGKNRLTEYKRTQKISIFGPLAERKDDIQIIGDQHYIMLSGHPLKLSVCAKTGYLKPTYIIHIDHKKSNPYYQVRIDLRSINKPYYSSIHKKENEYLSLDSAINDLEKQLIKNSSIKKTSKIKQRSKLHKKTEVNLKSFSNIHTAIDKVSPRLKFVLNLSGHNDKSKSRMEISIGTSRTFDLQKIKNALLTLSKISIAEAYCSTKKEYVHGILYKFNDFNIETQSAIIKVMSEILDTSQLDTTTALIKSNPDLPIGHIPIISLNKECKPSTTSNEYQIVSSQRRLGYLEGQLSRHDNLNNINVVNIDALINSNIEDVIYDHNVSYISGKSKMALSLSIAGLSKIAKEKVALKKVTEIDYKNLLKKLIPENKDLNNEIVFNHNDEHYSVHLKSNPNIIYQVRIANWLEERELAEVFLSNKVNIDQPAPNKKNKISIGLGNNKLRFKSNASSVSPLKNLYIADNGEIKYRGINQETNKRVRTKYRKPINEIEFINIIELCFKELLPFNKDEIKYLNEVYIQSYK